MRLFKTITGLRAYLEPQRQDKTIGLVPTMGALHPGHLSLMERAVAENDIVVASIFVNPLQFGANEDLDKYPRQLEKDAELCQQLGIDVIFAPEATEVYGSHPTTQVIPPAEMTRVLCGRFRPVFFPGIVTIVTKLLNIVQPTTAYFGEKDAQQLAIIRRLVADLNLPVAIKGCPMVREASGLAYSSRNQYLTPEQKAQALALSRSLRKAEQVFARGERNGSKLLEIVKGELALTQEIEVQYVELVDPETLKPKEKIERGGLLAIACYIGSTRLIDNVILRVRQPIIAIDGPAGAGKSTVARRVASALGLLYLDTGAMYRAVTCLVMRSGISVEDTAAIAELVSQAKLELIPADSPDRPVTVKINDQDVTEAIRSREVTANVSAVAAVAAVRSALVKQQQSWGEKGGVVMEGRDIGTNVFPDAELKIFLTASVKERARRRLEDLKKEGIGEISLAQLEQDIQQRDYQDSHRKIAPLTQAVDAIKVNTDGLTIEEVTDKIVSQL